MSSIEFDEDEDNEDDENLMDQSKAHTVGDDVYSRRSEICRGHVVNLLYIPRNTEIFNLPLSDKSSNTLHPINPQ